MGVKRIQGEPLFTVEPISAMAAKAPEPPVPSPVGNETPEACEICCEKELEVVFLPCTHGGLCWGCTETILSRSGNHCHYCRYPVQKVILVDNPARLLHGQTARARLLVRDN